MNHVEIAEIFAIFGLTGTVLLGAVAYLIKTLTAHFLDKDAEAFKAALQIEAEKQQYQYSILQEKRAEVMAELYRRLDLAQDSLRSLMSFLQGRGELSLEEKEKIADAKISEFISYYSSHKIYFDEETCNLIEEIKKIVKRARLDFEYRDRVKGSGPEEDLWLLAWREVTEDIPSVRKKLEDSFRAILGIEKK